MQMTVFAFGLKRLPEESARCAVFGRVTRAIRCAYHLDAEAAGHVAAALELLLRLEHRLDELAVLLAVRLGARARRAAGLQGAEAGVEARSERHRRRRHDELGVLVLLRLRLRAADAFPSAERALLALDYHTAPAARHAGGLLRRPRARCTRRPHCQSATSAARRAAHEYPKQ